MHFPELILASASPRRKALLEMADIPCTVCPVHVEETYPADMPAEEVAAFLARKKAEAAWNILQRATILAADSIVICNDKILEKPKDRKEAADMLRQLQGTSHTVFTGICLRSNLKTFVETVNTIVFVDPMDDEEINYYVDRYEPFDKAGAYGIQEWIGWCKVSRIEGSYANVMGLPVHLVYTLLREMTH